MTEATQAFEEHFAKAMMNVIDLKESGAFVCPNCQMQDVYQTDIKDMSFTCTNCLAKYWIEP